MAVLSATGATHIMMTRNDYILIARAYAKTRPSVSDALVQWFQDVSAIADVMATQNPRFNRSTFLEACGVEEHTL
jgi:hypothetical protein